MFICDRIQFNNHEYCIQDTHIKEIYQEATKRQINTLVLKEIHQKSISQHKWLRFSKKYNINLLFAKEFYCFTPFSENKMTLFFVSKNNREYTAIKRLSKLLKGQYIPYLSDEALDYFKRLQFDIWYINKEKVFNFFSKESIGNTPKVPFNSSDMKFFSPFFNTSVTDYGSFFTKDDALLNLSAQWDTSPTMKEDNMLLDVLNIVQQGRQQNRLIEELNWLKKTNQYKIFWLAFQLQRKMPQIEYKGAFQNFSLSYKLGLIANAPKKLVELKDNIHSEYILFTHPAYKNALFSTISEILKPVHYEIKFPYKKDNILFSSVVEWFKKPNVDIDIETIVLYKDLYDEMTKDEKVKFFEKMKMYFLLYPEAKEAFKHALYFSKRQVHQRVFQNSKAAIVKEFDYEITDNYINIDIEDLKKESVPLITFNFTKKNP